MRQELLCVCCLLVSSWGLVSPGSTLILGGGFAGTYTALQLSRLRPETKVTVVDERPRFTFLPLLYEYAVGLASKDEVSASFDDLFGESPNIEFLLGAVESVDASKRRATLADGRVLENYDSMVLALGRETGMTLPSSEMNGTYVTPFYRLEDAEGLRKRLPTAEKCVVVGGGFTGVELACNLAMEKKSRKVLLVHRSPRLVPSASEHNRAAAADALRKVGVQVVLGQVERVDEKDKIVILKDGNIEDVDVAVYTIGSRLAKPLMDLPAIHRVKGDVKQPLAIDAALRLRLNDDGPKNVFALGDAAKAPGPSVAPSAQVALQEALVCARNVAAYLDDRPPRPFSYIPLGELLAYGPQDGSGSLLPQLDLDILNIEGPVAGLARRLVYAARMPTPAQRITSLAGLLSSSLEA